jgi:hypothetical protein
MLETSAPRGVARIPAQTVVHSSKAGAMNGSFTPPRRRVTAMFHAQLIDCNAISQFGVFFAMRSAMLECATLRTHRRAACTGLSTIRVDKGKNPSAPDACSCYLPWITTSRRKSHHWRRRPCDLPR